MTVVLCSNCGKHMRIRGVVAVVDDDDHDELTGYAVDFFCDGCGRSCAAHLELTTTWAFRSKEERDRRWRGEE